MTLEETLTSMAESLKTIADLQGKMLGVAERNQARLEAIHPTDTPPMEYEKPEIADTGWTYDTLKDALQQRGVEIKKATKMTTLVKLWTEHKDDPIADAPDRAAAVSEAVTPGVEAPELPVMPKAEEPARADEHLEPGLPLAEVPPEDLPVAKPEPPKSMTAAELLAEMRKVYHNTDEERAIVKELLVKYGAERVTTVKDEFAAQFLAEYLAKKGQTNA